MVLSYLDAKDVAPMTEAISRLFMDCILAERAEQKTAGKLEPFSEKISQEAGPAGQIFEKRLSWPHHAGQQCATVSVPCAIFVIMLSGGSPGKIVMWAYTINRLYQRKRDMVTMDDLAHAFPIGFPTEQAEHELWDAQKARRHGQEGDNMVDKIETWFVDPYKPVEIVFQEQEEAPDINLETVGDEPDSAKPE